VTFPDDDGPMTSPATPSALASPSFVVRELADGAECVDCFEDLDEAGCVSLLQADKVAVGQYLERLTAAKIATILNTTWQGRRLGLFVISECLAPGWEPTEAMGLSKGAEMVRLAQGLGLPRELPLALDYEGPAASTSLAAATEYLEATGGVILSDRRPAELYVGFRPILSGVQLYELPQFTRYYASSPYSPELPCGYVLVQRAWNVKLGRLLVDLDDVQADAHQPSRLPLALFAS
jgi:hypothetical protein